MEVGVPEVTNLSSGRRRASEPPQFWISLLAHLSGSGKNEGAGGDYTLRPPKGGSVLSLLNVRTLGLDSSRSGNRPGELNHAAIGVEFPTLLPRPPPTLSVPERATQEVPL